MNISDKDLKKLWGLAAGRCSKPGCQKECIKFLQANDPTIIGEMAHVIAKSPKGPRGIMEGGKDEYENLLLLCPTHHREIDKAPEGTYPEGVLFEWKAKHEEWVRKLLEIPSYDNVQDLCLAIKKILIKNNISWKTFGPESSEAKRNPISNLKLIWDLRKLDMIIPNNTRMIQLIQNNEHLFSLSEYEAFVEFEEHAIAFERNCYDRTEGVPRFPMNFVEVIDHHVRI
ncbi:MAG: HNH endonuclease signature motif containing protein [Desulfobacteraceae bacterium]|jgi:hypothetical protein|nr:HNH endonuclease signature motif containing protein [Desulfobacteraceae bacterium]